MERYIIRERRMSDYPQSKQSSNQIFPGANNEVSPVTLQRQRSDDVMYLERSLHQNHFPHNIPMYMPYTSVNNKQDFGNAQINSPGYMVNCLPPGQGPMVSGIDPRYLAAYADPNANYIATGQQIQRERDTMPANSAFSGEYQNRGPPERNLAKTFTPKERHQEQTMYKESPKPYQKDTQTTWQPVNTKCPQEPTMILEPPKPYQQEKQTICQPLNSTAFKKTEASDVHKSEIQNQIMSRADKLKALHRSGARVFSGPVEKVLKWHKALQDIGVYVLYEIVAKCVSIRTGEQCAKNLVVRDESGPAMQIVYYEVDFLLPELKPPCTIRIIGRMMAGTSRFQAFNVRSATGDDVATLPRRAAVAAHHVAKICKEYST